VPHPLDDLLEIKVQTTCENTNGVVKGTLQLLEKELFEMENEFDRAVGERLKM
jgi:DNA-directed RNA polymerase subunit L